MINEEKVILMTKMQAYEDGEGKRHVAIASYFRSDYLGFQVLNAVISVTIALIIIYAAYILYDLESFMKNLYQMDLVEYIKNLAKNYLIIMGAYALLTYAVYAFRYAKAKKSLKAYYGNLKKLNALYNREA